jgi:hypothetical protein
VVRLLDELQDLAWRAGLLPRELVAREREHREAIVVVLFVQRLQLAVVLLRVPAGARDVDHEDDGVLRERRERHLVAPQVLHREVQERRLVLTLDASDLIPSTRSDGGGDGAQQCAHRQQQHAPRSHHWSRLHRLSGKRQSKQSNNSWKHKLTDHTYSMLVFRAMIGPS